MVVYGHCSAGGGGKTAARRDKIKEKNAKLNEERAQRIKKEKEKEKEKGEAAGNDTHGGKTQEQRDEEAIHPSRRSRVPYGQQK
jgi:nucleolar protein 6